MKLWHTIDVEVDREAEELASDQLWALEPTGLQIVQEGADSMTLRAFYAQPVDATEVISRIEDVLAAAGLPTSLLRRVTWSTVPDEDWLAEWKKTWTPVPVGESFLIVPSWKLDTANPDGRLVIQIDPGMAFGTGTHETTRGVLRLLERYWLNPELAATLLDVGTGTGILSMAAVALAWANGLAPTAVQVAACDTDPEAITVAQENVATNDMVDAIELVVGSAGYFAGQQFSMVLANLTADVIEAIAADLAAVIAPGGMLIVSGILLDQLDGVLAALTPLGLTEVERLPDGEWVSVALDRASF